MNRQNTGQDHLVRLGPGKASTAWTRSALLLAVLILSFVALITVPRKPITRAEVFVTQTPLCAWPDEAMPYSLTFSTDGWHYAFVVRRNGKSVVVVDGREGKEEEDAGYLLENATETSADSFEAVSLGPDAVRPAYVAKRGGKFVVVSGAAESGPYDEIMRRGGGGDEHGHRSWWAPAMTPDGAHLAYGAKENGKWFVVADGVRGREYDEISYYGPAYGPDGKSLAYCARRASDWYRVVDGVETGTGDPAELAWPAQTVAGQSSIKCIAGAHWLHRLQDRIEQLTSLRFQRRIDGGGVYMAWKGRRSRLYNDVYLERRSDSAQHCAALMGNGDCYVVLDAVEQKDPVLAGYECLRTSRLQDWAVFSSLGPGGNIMRVELAIVEK